MDDPGTMGMLKRLKELLEKPDGTLGLQRARLLYDFCKRDALDVLHHDAETQIGFEEGEDGNDVRTLEASKSFGFGAKSRHEGIITGEEGIHDLQGDFSIEFYVSRLVDNAHPPSSEESCNLEVVKSGPNDVGI
jgi:hypothetical protein